MLNQPKELLIDLPLGVIAAKAWGNDQGLPVLALHGWLDNAASFNFLAPELLKEFSAIHPNHPGLFIVAIDCFGHGRSSHHQEGHNYNLLEGVRDAFLVANAMGWDDFSLLSHSMGAGIASVMSGTFPNRIKHLALLEVLGPFSSLAQSAPDQLAKFISSDMKYIGKKPSIYSSLDAMIKARQHGFSEVTREAAEALVHRGYKKVPGGYSWSSDVKLKIPTMQYLVEAQTQTFLRNIAAPTVLVFGEQGMFSEKDFADRIACVSNIEVRTFVGSHHLHMEQATPQIAACFAQLYAS